MRPSVVDVLAHRMAAPTGSTGATARPDGYRVCLVIEGGGSRAAYSTGMVGALQKRGLTACFDAVYGSSAGALNGAWLLCDRAPNAMAAWTAPGLMRKVMNVPRAVYGRPVVDIDYLVNVLYTDLVPIDFEAVLANPVSLHPIGTDAADGAAVDLASLISDVPTLKLALQATSNLPVMAGPPVALGGGRFIDGGVAEPVPIQTALAQGATHVLVLRTRRPDELSAPPGRLARRFTTRWFRRHAPGATPAWDHRPARAIELERLLAESSNVLQIRPPVGSPPVSRIATDAGLLGSAVDIGFRAAEEVLAGLDSSGEPGAV